METPVAPAVPCKISKNNQNWAIGSRSNKIKSKLACDLEASESTRLHMGDSLPNLHEDHFAGKGDSSLQHYILVHKFILMSQAMRIPAATAAVDEEWEKLEKISAWNLTKVSSKKEGRKSSFRLNDWHMSFEKCWIGGKTPKTDHQHHKWQ